MTSPENLCHEGLSWEEKKITELGSSLPIPISKIFNIQYPIFKMSFFLDTVSSFRMPEAIITDSFMFRIFYSLIA